MVLEEEVKISEVSEFSVLPYTQNGKLGNLRKCSFASNFGSSCNLKYKNNKRKLTNAKIKDQDIFFRSKSENF